MWQAFQRYRALDPQARRLFRRTVRLLLLIAASLRLRGFNKTKSHLQRKLPPDLQTGANTDAAAEKIQRTCRMLSAAAHYGPWHTTCLEQSLALWYLLRKQNIPASLRIGVRKSQEKFQAHAWVECAGAALNEAEGMHRHYSAFATEFSEMPGEKR
jgi:hypothetical protein